MVIVIFFVALWYTSLFCQTFFQHRYAAHAAFKMSNGWEKFFFLLTYALQGSSYLSPRAYAVMHRVHHAYTDTDKDPHSPSFSKNIWDMMWQTKNQYTAYFDRTADVEERFTKNVPDWPAFDKFANSGISRLLWIGIYAVFFAFYAQPWEWIFFPIICAMGPVHGAVINWFAHKYGYRNFEQKNTSENLLPIDILMLGESYHNNHHKYPSSVNFGRKWHEIDPVYPIIRVLDWVRIIKINKQPALAELTPTEHTRKAQMEEMLP